MNKEEYIERRGEAAYDKMLGQTRAWQVANPERVNAIARKWKVANPEKAKAIARNWKAANPDKVLASNHEWGRKGGKYYEKMLKDQRTGLPGERNHIRYRHGKRWFKYKQIIAPDSQIHHEWIPGTAEYTGVALVETNPHQYGIVDVIKILEGKITLFTEKEIREQGRI